MVIPKIKDIDIPFIFKKNIFTNDINLIKGNAAIKHSIKNLILTIQGERRFQPKVGTILSDSLFELATDDMHTEIENSIKSVLSDYEQRITNVDVSISLDIKTPNKVSVNITYTNISTEDEQLLSIVIPDFL